MRVRVRVEGFEGQFGQQDVQGVQMSILLRCTAGRDHCQAGTFRTLQPSRRKIQKHWWHWCLGKNSASSAAFKFLSFLVEHVGLEAASRMDLLEDTATICNIIWALDVL